MTTAKDATTIAELQSQLAEVQAKLLLADIEDQTGLSGRQLYQLLSPLNPNRIKALKGMSYLEAWDVKASLIRVFGFGNFSSELIESKILRAAEKAQASNPNKMNWQISVQATVRLTIHATGAIYTEGAVGGSQQPDWTESADMALKTAESDALKRAAIFLGTQFGLSLYDDGATHDIVRTILDPQQSETFRAELERRSSVAAQQAGQANAPQIESVPAGNNPEAAQGHTAPGGPSVADAFKAPGA